MKAFKMKPVPSKNARNVKNRATTDNRGDFSKLYRNFDIIFEITFIIVRCAVFDGTGNDEIKKNCI
jgi:hypothetical protein